MLNVLCQVFETNTELLLLMLLKVSLFLYTHFILVKQTHREFSLFPCSTCSVFFYIEKMTYSVHCSASEWPYLNWFWILKMCFTLLSTVLLVFNCHWQMITWWWLKSGKALWTFGINHVLSVNPSVQIYILHPSHRLDLQISFFL